MSLVKCPGKQGPVFKCSDIIAVEAPNVKHFLQFLLYFFVLFQIVDYSVNCVLHVWLIVHIFCFWLSDSLIHGIMMLSYSMIGAMTMAAPLYDSLLSFAQTNPLRMHMPGHKGACEGLFSEITPIDFTEIVPTGNLYTGEGAITEAEALCANYAGAKSALFFTCGSTQGIYTMLAEAVGMGGELILERGCHKSVYNAMALLDITPHYIYAPPIPGTPLSGAVTPELVENALCRYPASKAVFLTSPTYYGVVTDLAPISALCHVHSAFLLVDQAHGAHFPSVGLPSAPEQDADLSVVSTHKTWPALGSSSVLYVGSDFFDRLHLKKTSSLFGTTSPSYPILASIDYARDRLEGSDGDAYRRCANLTAALRERINRDTPFHALIPSADLILDPCRLTIDTLSAGLPGHSADELLAQKNIYVEMSDEQYLVLILTCRDDEAAFDRLWDGILSLIPHCNHQAKPEILSVPPKPEIRCSIRDARFGNQETLPLSQAAGRIAAEIIAPYPPGIPILAPGEEISQKHIAYLQKKSYNIEEYIAVLLAAEF